MSEARTGKRMKRLTEFRNLPVVNVADGNELGAVNSFLIDTEQGKLAGFVLASKPGGHGVRVVPLSAVSSFGSFAMTLKRDGEAVDLIGDPYLLSLFEKDVPLLGSKVFVENVDKTIGFVKDVGVSVEDGELLLLTITSDAGFTSPYRASIPYGAVVSADRDTVVIKSDERLRYVKMSAAGSAGADSAALVPLVIEEHKLAEAMNERVREEMEKVMSGLRSALGFEFERHFLSKHKEPMASELLAQLKGSIEAVYENKFNEAARAFRELLMETARGLVKGENFETRMAAAGNDAKRINDELSSRMESSVEALRNELAAAKAGLSDAIRAEDESTRRSLESVIDSMASKLESATDRKLRTLSDEIAARVEDASQAADTRLLKIDAGARDFEKSLRASIEQTRAFVSDEVSQAMAAMSAQLEEARAKFSETLDRAAKESSSAFASFKRNIEAEITKIRQESEAAKQEISRAAKESDSKIGSAITEAKAETAELIRSLKDELFGRMNDEMRAVKEEIKSVEMRIPALDPADVREELSSAMAEMEARMDGMAEKSAATESALREAETKLEGAADKSELEKASAKLEAAIKDESARLTSLMEIFAEKEALSSAMAEMEARMDGMAEKSAATESALREAETKLEDAADKSELENALEIFRMSKEEVESFMEAVVTTADYEADRIGIYEKLSGETERVSEETRIASESLKGVFEKSLSVIQSQLESLKDEHETLLESRLAAFAEKDSLESALAEISSRADSFISKTDAESSLSEIRSKLGAFAEKNEVESAVKELETLLKRTADKGELDRIKTEFEEMTGKLASFEDMEAGIAGAEERLRAELMGSLAPYVDSAKLEESRRSVLSQISEKIEGFAKEVSERIENITDSISNVSGVEERLRGELMGSLAPYVDSAKLEESRRSVLSEISEKMDEALEEMLEKIDGLTVSISKAEDAAQALNSIEGKISEIGKVVAEGARAAADVQDLKASVASLESRFSSVLEEVSSLSGGGEDGLDRKLIDLDEKLTTIERLIESEPVQDNSAVPEILEIEELKKQISELSESVKKIESGEGAGIARIDSDSVSALAEEKFEKWKKDLQESVNKEMGIRFAELEKLAEEAERKSADESGAIAETAERVFEGGLEKLREEMEREIEKKVAEARPKPVDEDALRMKVTKDLMEAAGGPGMIKLAFDPARLARRAEGFPEKATEENVADFFGGQHASAMLGKRAPRDIYTDDNVRVVQKGEALTEEVLRRARDYGKFIELSLDFKSGEGQSKDA
ncbi:MAG TPA: PRC-barrel domain-containing protein [bacterium]|nr:PRC-barrel domain-containing protein [bacterium]